MSTTQENAAMAAPQESAPIKSKKNNNPEPTKKKRQTPPMWYVLTKARNTFKVQLDKSNDVKLRCIQEFIPYKFRDAGLFWSDFMDQVEKLLDSRKYTNECKSLGLIPSNLAEHIVFRGSGTIKKVLENGVKNVLGNDVTLFKESFFPKKAQKFLTEITKDLDTGQTKEPKASIEASDKVETKPETGQDETEVQTEG
jgi:hypothetical protein